MSDVVASPLLSIVVKCQRYGDVYFRVKPETPFIKVFQGFNKKSSAADGELKFLFDGQRIKDTDTPATFDMENEDEIDAIPAVEEANQTNQKQSHKARKLRKEPTVKALRAAARKEKKQQTKEETSRRCNWDDEKDGKIVAERAEGRSFRQIGQDLGHPALLVRNRHATLMRRHEKQTNQNDAQAGQAGKAAEVSAT